jgi:hypothetical protein
VAYVLHADFKQLLLEELFASASPPKQGWTSIYNTGVTVVEFSNPHPRLKIYNSVEHLSRDLISM